MYFPGRAGYHAEILISTEIMYGRAFGAQRIDSMPREFKSGFVAVVGRPNAGKSTLVNRLVGEKVAIVTSKPQTTRNRIHGIVNRPDAQVVLIDTPGLHRPDSALGRQMMGEVEAAVDAVDVLALILDASEKFGRGDQR